MTAPSFHADLKPQDGEYATAVVQIGVRRHAIVGFNAAGPQLEKLIGELNAELPPASRLAVPRPPSIALPPGPCTGSGRASNVFKLQSLKQAAAARLATFTSKGVGVAADAIAIDGIWREVKAPTTISVNLEVTGPAGVSANWARFVYQSAAPVLNRGLVLTSGPQAGSPVRFVLNVRNRVPGSPPRPCFHQIQLSSDPHLASYVSGLGPRPQTGNWNLHLPAVFAHEILHLVGLPDRFEAYFKAGTQLLPAPTDAPSGQLVADTLAAAPIGIGDGVLRSRSSAGHERDPMATLTEPRLTEFDALELANHADIVIHATPGDTLVDKEQREKNVIVPVPFSLLVPYHGRAHANGLYAFGVDYSRFIPRAGRPFDALGVISAVPGRESNAGLLALRRLITVIDLHTPPPAEGVGGTPGGTTGDPGDGTPSGDPTGQTPGGGQSATPPPGEVPPGAQCAIDHVTDNRDLGSCPPDSAQLLTEAGIPTGDASGLGTDHFTDPASALSETAAVTPTDVLGTTLPTGEADFGGAKVKSIGAFGRLPRAGKGRRQFSFRAIVAGGEANFTLVIKRQAQVKGKKGKGRRKKKQFKVFQRLGKKHLREGENIFSAVLRSPRAGKYQLVITGPKGQRSTGFTIKGKKSRRRRR